MDEITHGKIKVIHFELNPEKLTEDSSIDTDLKGATFKRTDTYQIAGFTLRWRQRMSPDVLSFIAEDDYFLSGLENLSLNDFRQVVGVSQRKFIEEFDILKKEKGVTWSILAKVDSENVKKLLNYLQEQI